MPDDQGLYITHLRISNFMRLKLVDTDLRTGLTLVTGQNGQGKSSFLKAIVTLFGGARYRPKFALRQGARRGLVLARLSNGYQIEARCGAADEWTTTLVDTKIAKGLKGHEIKKVQTQLDILRGELTFNALDYLDMTKEKQLEIYRKLGGASFADLDAKRDEVYNERTAINKAVKQEEGLLANLIQYPDAPPVEISYPELTAELTRRHAIKAANDDARKAAKDLGATAQEKAKAYGERMAETQRIREQLALAEHAELLAHEAMERSNKEAWEALQEMDKLVDPDIAEVQARINDAGAINRKVKANAEHRSCTDRLEWLRANSQELTDQLDDLKGEKLARLKAAEESMPVKGLSLDGDLVLYRGLPLDQLSGAESVVLCVEIGAALHPRLSTILLDDLEKLNKDRLELLANIATGKGLQIIACLATEPGEGSGIEIEAGMIRGFEEDEDDASADDELPMFP